MRTCEPGSAGDSPAAPRAALRAAAAEDREAPVVEARLPAEEAPAEGELAEEERGRDGRRRGLRAVAGWRRGASRVCSLRASLSLDRSAATA
jgi:hypothetical protein